MPFTPFHMGPALVTKAVLGRHFSVPLYGFMQVAIDSEVLAGYPFRGDLAFHKILHTFAGGDCGSRAHAGAVAPCARARDALVEPVGEC